MKNNIVKFLGLPIVFELEKTDNAFPKSSYIKFRSKHCYYNFISFRPKISNERFFQKPSFIFHNYTDNYHISKSETGKKICITQHFIIDMENAIKNKEIEFIDTEQLFKKEDYNINIQSYKEEIFELNDNFNSEFITEQELMNETIDRNVSYCLKVGKWKCKIKKTIIYPGLLGYNKNQ